MSTAALLLITLKLFLGGSIVGGCPAREGPGVRKGGRIATPIGAELPRAG